MVKPSEPFFVAVDVGTQDAAAESSSEKKMSGWEKRTPFNGDNKTIP